MKRTQQTIGLFSSDFYSDLPAVDDMRTSSRIYSHRIHVTGIFAYIWLIFMVNIGKYTSPMDPKGFGIQQPPPCKTHFSKYKQNEGITYFVYSGNTTHSSNNAQGQFV